MKLAVFNDNRVGLVEGDKIYDVTAAIPGAGSAEWPPVFMTRMIVDWVQSASRINEEQRRKQPLSCSDVKLHAPLPLPGNIIAAPANYRKHVGELGDRSIVKAGHSARELGFFLKASSSVVGPGSPIVLPRSNGRRFDHESELAVIIGKRAKNVPRERALAHVFGYTCLVDVTMRLEPGKPAEERPTRKSFDTFTPLGPWIVTADEISDPQALSNRLWVNGELRQSANTSDMTVGVAELIEIVSSVITLNPGDVIATGTPEGVGPIKPGDELRIEIERIGAMSLKVIEADDAAPKQF